MKIHVRKRHIEKGKMANSQSCPIALAAQECLGYLGRIRVLNFTILAGRESYVLPRAALRFIARFDSGKPVKPFAFVLK